jgi:DNA-binding LytR/AlgR family response regulator
MKVIIIEDEQLAARRLESMIKKFDNEIEIVASLESIEESVKWLTGNPHPDLIFLDIHLEDGISFSIFEKVKVNAPIIFTTAFDEYAIKAFKLKSIDYLLKPIVQEDLNRAIEKFNEMTVTSKPQLDFSGLFKIIQDSNPQFRERFSVSVGEKLKTVEVKDIAYFFSTNSITFMVLHGKNQYSLDQSLDKLIDELNPKDFFRINRQFLVSHKAINNVNVYPKSRIQIQLTPPAQEDIFVSIDRVPYFKRWFDGSL